MKKLILIIAIVFSGMLMQAQSHTYDNNINARSKMKSGISWTISNVSNGVYKISYSPCWNNQCSINVKYSRYDSASKLYIYVPSGSNSFDGGILTYVMASGKLSDLSNGIAPNGANVFGTIDPDIGSYVYILSN